MPRTLLEVVTEALVGTGVSAPTTIIAGNALAQQLRRIADTTAFDIAKRHMWEPLKTEATFSAIASETQFTLKTNYPYFSKLVPATIFNRTLQQQMRPLSAEQWARLKADGVQPASEYYRVRAGAFLMLGSFALNDTIAFEYITTKIISNTNGVTTYERFTNDTDYFLLDDMALVLGIRWRWRYEKGYEYGEQMREYEDRIAYVFGGDSEAETLSMTPRAPVSAYEEAGLGQPGAHLTVTIS